MADSFQLFLRSAAGRTVAVRAAPGDRVGALRRRLWDAEGIPPGAVRLIYGGRQLEDHHTLAHYRIARESTIHAVYRLRGGMYAAASGRRDLDELLLG